MSLQNQWKNAAKPKPLKLEKPVEDNARDKVKKAVENEPEDEDSMHDKQQLSSPDWLAQSIKQSVADWRLALKKDKEALMKKKKPAQVETQAKLPSDPYVEEFSSGKFGSGKFGTGTLEFIKLEQQVKNEQLPNNRLDPFADPAIVPKHLPKTSEDDQAQGGGSYARIHHQNKLD